eukprot:TRINITY_DN10181_c2_g1_i1.p1 TRINITY_DN10181_c2_g1~~TRINITY_DN10181_c2_g1_i1.p1  ORF type:complete len:125 (-),score=5.68 TRINITY_DN10181_c2_g1_i1:31-405(-)
MISACTLRKRLFIDDPSDFMCQHIHNASRIVEVHRSVAEVRGDAKPSHIEQGATMPSNLPQTASSDNSLSHSSLLLASAARNVVSYMEGSLTSSPSPSAQTYVTATWVLQKQLQFSVTRPIRNA